MLFYRTNRKSKHFLLPDVVLKGLAPDQGLFLPKIWPKLSKKFFKQLPSLSFHQIAFEVGRQFFSQMPARDLKQIITQAFTFPAPLRKLSHGTYVLELFHGPTMAFKDFGARFLARTMGYLLKVGNQELNIIVATSGDTGSAVASGFFKVPKTRVFILYPSGKVSPLQEKQLTTYGHNVTALEVKGTFDDCQKLAKQVLADKDLNEQMQLSSANSINFGRLLPQSFYYFWALGQLKKLGEQKKPAVAVPSGNFGNLFAGLMAKKMGLPIFRFVAATNSNSIVPKYLESGKFDPQKSKHTLSNAMDVGNPSNFARMLDMYDQNFKKMAKDIVGFSVSDADTKKTIKQVYKQTGYILDPHTAVGVKAALEYKKSNASCPIIVLSTAHPAKFGEIVEPVIKKKLKLPKQLEAAMKKKKQVIKVSKSYKNIRKILLSLS